MTRTDTMTFDELLDRSRKAQREAEGLAHQVMGYVMSAYDHGETVDPNDSRYLAQTIGDYRRLVEEATFFSDEAAGRIRPFPID